MATRTRRAAPDDLYAVVDSSGDVYLSSRGRPMIYASFTSARRQARRAGDCVVPVIARLDREPLYIRESRRG